MDLRKILNKKDLWWIITLLVIPGGSIVFLIVLWRKLKLSK